MAKDTPPKSDRDNKGLDEAISRIEKNFGKNAVMRLGDKTHMQVETTPTGSLSLDVALGGGLPRGRLVEIFGVEGGGKTTLTLHCVAEMQKKGGVCAFIDAEHALDPEYARTLGVDIDNLYISQPDNGEQGLEIADTLVRSGAIDMVVIDSVAALTPRAEIEGEMGEMQVGGMARLMSHGCRKLAGSVGRANATVIFINQIREKIGVMYGCFSEETLVLFADGSQHTIREVVDNQLEGPVLSWNSKTGDFEPKRIIDWHINGEVPEGGWVQFLTSAPGSRNGFSGWACTPDHNLYYADGTAVAAKEVREGDELLTYKESLVLQEETHRNIIYGSLLGDGRLALRKNTTATFVLRNQEQPEYLQWKLDHLPLLNMRKDGNESRPCYKSQHRVELQDLRQEFYPQGRGYRQIPEGLKLTPQMLAIWYMDDGCLRKDTNSFQASISIKRFRESDLIQTKAIQLLVDMGIGCTYQSGGYCIHIKSNYLHDFFTMISPHMPDCMQHKLPPYYQGRYIKPQIQNIQPKLIPYAAQVLKVEPASNRKYRNRNKYDISVEDNHNYIVSQGIVVSNSPETTPGGRALKFFCSVRLRVSRGEPLKNGTEQIGARTKIRVDKNKIAPPFREAEFDLIFGKGINKYGDILDLAVQQGLIQKGGAWFTVGTERLQGRETVRDYLESHPDLAADYEAQIRTALLTPKKADIEESADES